MFGPRFLLSFAAVCLFSGVTVAQLPPPAPPIAANPNRVAAGKLDNGILSVQLEIVRGVWHAEAENGPVLFVQAFAEAGHIAQIPGPMFRVPQNTTVHVTVTNKVDTPATVYGFVTRPATEDPGVVIAPGRTEEITFASGAPGTYLYWARTTAPVRTPAGNVRAAFEDAQLNGAFIVDPPGPQPAERIFVINTMLGRPNAITERFEVATINGKEYPYTDALEYTAGDTIRWRVINPSFSEHPMHLHGAFFKVVSVGNIDEDTQYGPGEQQEVVTQDVRAGETMVMEWKPSHVGRWLFHCHFHAHMSSDERVPVIGLRRPHFYGNPERVAGTPLPHDPEGALHDMGGLMLFINIKAKPGTPREAVARHPRKLQLVLRPEAAHAKLLSVSIRDGSNVVTSKADQSVGPPLVLARDEPVEITVVNHLVSPATIHWHGLELESYYDGVMGAGVGDQMTPAIPPGGTFVVRFTPNRAGTFIYHTHAPDPEQLSGGIYGALIVLAPGQKYDPDHDRLLVIGTRDTFFTAQHITVNGSESFPPMLLERGVKYRLRIIDMAPNLPGTVIIGTKENPGKWRAVAKDGADVPLRLNKITDSDLQIASGEAYDFEFQPDTAGEIPITVMNRVNGAKLEGKIVVQDGTAVASNN